MRTSHFSLPRLRLRLLSASSYLCLALLLVDSSQSNATDIAAKPGFVGKATFRERSFISVEGGYWFNNSARNLAFDPDDFLVQHLSPLKPGRDGGTFAVAFGRTFGPQWDWAVAYRYASLRTSSVSSSAASSFSTGLTGTDSVDASASNRFWYQHLDLEFGYRPPQWQAANVRVFFGSRVLHARNKIHYQHDGVTTITSPPLGDFDKLGNFEHDINLWGFGPRAGLQASLPLAQSPLSLDASGSAAAIFSRVNHKTAFSFMNENFPDDDIGSGTTRTRSSPIVYNLEGSLALGYRPSNTLSVQVGYQAQQWWNLATGITSADSEGRFQSGRSDVLVHGPFAKLTVELP